MSTYLKNLFTPTPIQTAISEARKALESGDCQLAEKMGLEMCQVYEREFNVSEAEFGPSHALLEFQCLEVLMDLHIIRGDAMDVVLRFGQMVKRFEAMRKHYPSWSDEDWKPVEDIVAGVAKKVYSFNQKGIVGDWAPVKRNAECRCELCLKNKADKTGSHMVPHLLIADAFSYDGSRDRDKVTVAVDALGEGKHERYFGRQVYEDTISRLLGRSLTDEELDDEAEKTNALTLDHVFCSECEKRLGVIESWYADIMKGCGDYPPQVPYLFWMSVVWRMAVGNMGMVLASHHQEKLRKTLDKCLSLSRDGVVLQSSKLGHCAYSVYKADDTRDETPFISGPYEMTKPYQAMMGRYLINYYTSASAAVSFSKAHGLSVEDLNDGSRAEKIGRLSFIEYWSAKRQILDMSWKNGRSIWNIGRSEHRTLSRMEPSMTRGKDDPHDIPLWFNSENPMAVNIPRSIKKINDWVEGHQGDWTIEEMSKDLGYSQDEICVMLDYWNGKANEYERNMERGEKVMRGLEKVLDLV